MPFNDPYTVNVRVSKGDPLGEAMNRIRAWLDSQKIQPAEFKTAANANGYTFSIAFRDTSQADLFRAHFSA